MKLSSSEGLRTKLLMLFPDNLKGCKKETFSLHTKLQAIRSAVPTWVQDIKTTYGGYIFASDLIAQLVVDLKGPNLWHY